MQIVRRTVQVTVLMLIIMIPLFNYYGIKIHQKDDASIRKSIALSAIHSVFRGEDREEVIQLSHKVKGSIWTINIFGFKISDPLAVLESTVTTFYLYWPMILSMLIPLLFTLILGRVYCGWLCPYSLLSDLIEKLRKLLEKTGYRTRDIQFNKKTKYWSLSLGLIAAYFAGMPLLSLLYPPAVISREIFYKIYNNLWGNGILIIGLFLFFELILSKRWWCRYICPGGAVYIGLSSFCLLKIKRVDSLCTLCGDCDPVCPYDLKPMTKEISAECDLCCKCVGSCQPNALKYTFGRK
jgi:ferredoxin-type protein NapH